MNSRRMQELPSVASRALTVTERPELGLAAESRDRADARGPYVVVVDPSCFTLPYDYCLCNALVRGGCKVLLVQSEFLYANWDLRKSFNVSKHFYQYTHKWA